MPGSYNTSLMQPMAERTHEPMSSAKWAPAIVRIIKRRTCYVMPIIPERLATTCSATPERRAWLEQLPNTICELQDRWSLSLAAPFDGNEVSCAWVAPAVRSDG